MHITRDLKKLTAIYRVKLGEPASAVATDLKVTPHTLGRWVADYQRPSADLLADLIAEAMVTILVGGARGADLTGLVNAFKIVTGGAESDVFDSLMAVGGQAVDDAPDDQPADEGPGDE